MGQRKHPLNPQQKFYCRNPRCEYEATRERMERGGDVEANLINGRWFACPNCGERMYTTRKARRKNA
uniref:Uncharacterized protein n=1 Tax=viral metagenome TaxID=1070528 RepID=A0A6M3LT67_9ZZZZ